MNSLFIPGIICGIIATLFVTNLWNYLQPKATLPQDTCTARRVLHYYRPEGPVRSDYKASYLPKVMMSDQRFFLILANGNEDLWRAGTNHYVCQHRDSVDGHLTFYGRDEIGTTTLYLSDGFVPVDQE